MKNLLFALCLITAINIKAQTTAIPDPNFEQALIDLGLDTGTPNGVIPTNNIDTITNLRVWNNNIGDLTGIENFTALTELRCSGNQLTSLDLTQNTALTYLLCHGNQLTSLDLTQNTALTELSCGENQLTSLDLTQNTALTILFCTFNQLTSLDLTQNTALTYLTCIHNQLTSLDLTQNTALTELYCGENQLTSVDLTQNTALTVLYCGYNQLTSLDLTQNTALTRLTCVDNQLTSLDLTQNTALTQLWCPGNQLTCLNLKNGNNLNLNDLAIYSNPNLNCVEVDDVAYSNANWLLYFGTQTSFSTNCNNTCSGIPCSVNANFTATDNGNGNYSFTDNSLGDYTQIHWAFGDGSVSTINNPNHTFSSNGIYSVVLTVNDSVFVGSCFDYYITTINVTGVSSPLQCKSGFVMYPDTNSNDIIVVNSSTGNNLTYLWDFGDGNTSNLQNPNHTYTLQGTYYLCLTIDDGNGCIDTYCDSIGNNGVVFKTSGFNINVISPSAIGIEENNLPNLSLYPNPTTGSITIDLEETKSNLNLSLTNALGQVVLTKNYRSTNHINIDLDTPKGVYFLRLEVDGEVITKKIIKE